MGGLRGTAERLRLSRARARTYICGLLRISVHFLGGAANRLERRGALRGAPHMAARPGARVREGGEA